MKRLAALLIVTAGSGSAQFLYNERLDKKSQDARTATKSVASGDVFDKELQNLDRLWKASSARVFQTAELQMNADLHGFFTWEQVGIVVRRVNRDFSTAQQQSQADSTQFEALKHQLKTDKDAASTALQNLKHAA